MGQIVALSLWCRGTNITDLQAVCTLVLLGLNAGIPHFGYETSQITQVMSIDAAIYYPWFILQITQIM